MSWRTVVQVYKLTVVFDLDRVIFGILGSYGYINC